MANTCTRASCFINVSRWRNDSLSRHSNINFFSLFTQILQSSVSAIAVCKNIDSVACIIVTQHFLQLKVYFNNSNKCQLFNENSALCLRKLSPRLPACKGCQILIIIGRNIAQISAAMSPTVKSVQT